jgi:Tfp pilus assembly protein PilX
MMRRTSAPTWLSAVRARLRSESGFTMLLALGVLMVTALLSAAVFEAVGGDTQLSRADLDGKRAYASAQAGLQTYLFQLNSHATTSQWWETCANDTQTAVTVPGSTTGVYYSYKPVNTCVATNPVGSLINTTTGTLGMEFTGYSGAGCPTAGGQCQTRTIVASLRTLSPLSFLWYTVYETKDSTLSGTNCEQMYYNNASMITNSDCTIYWVTGDQMNGPMYTQDQYLIYPNDAPTFGRSGADDIASEADVAHQSASNSGADICAGSNCYNDRNILGTADPSPNPTVKLPSDNSSLLSDAQTHGVVLNGTTTLTINGTQAVGETCTAAAASNCTPVSIDLTATPIIYATNLPGCNTTYTPDNVNYQSFNYTNPNTGVASSAYYGTCGDIYVQGSYSTPMTLAAANDIVLTNNLENSTDTDGQTTPTGSATAGLVADQYVRVMHGNSSNPDRTIDAAILTLSHSFFVDNYDGGVGSQGTLTVHGAIAQYFRGVVGTVSTGPGTGSGYLKDYNYDNRLQVVLPPYLFDLQVTEWQVFRESICQGSSC